MKANKKAQRNRRQSFSAKQRKEKAKGAEWYNNVCKFHSELEQLISDSLLTTTETENEVQLLIDFIKERNKTRVLFGKDDLLGVFASIMKAQPIAQEIVKCMEAETISFTILEGE